MKLVFFQTHIYHKWWRISSWRIDYYQEKNQSIHYRSLDLGPLRIDFDVED